MTAWTSSELAAIGDAEEIALATRRADGTLRARRVVWVVRHGDQLYVRSVNGRDAAWYRGVQTRRAGQLATGSVEQDVTFTDADHALDDQLDASYQRKYGRYPGPTARITAEAARETTLRLDRA
jgi:hypothetical protein